MYLYTVNPSTIWFFKCWKPLLNFIHTWTISFLFTLSGYFQFKGKCFTLPESTQLSSTTNKKETSSGFYPQAKSLRHIFRTWPFVSKLHWITSTLGQSTPHTDDLSCSLHHVHRHLALRCTDIPSLLDYSVAKIMSGTGKAVVLSCQRMGTTQTMARWLSCHWGSVLYVNWGPMTCIWWPATDWTTSKGSDFLTSLFPVALCNELLVVQAWLREKGKEWELSHTGKDRCMQACSHTHIHTRTVT